MAEIEIKSAINRLMCGNTAHSCKAGYIKLAIQALEKQIPKDIIREKGEIYRRSVDGKESHLIVLKCPTCGRTDLEHDYPCKCGQILKWGE